MTLEVGDRVRVVRPQSFLKGREGTVLEIDENLLSVFPVRVALEALGDTFFDDWELEVIE